MRRLTMVDACLTCGQPVHAIAGVVMDTTPPIVTVTCLNGHEDGRYEEWPEQPDVDPFTGLPAHEHGDACDDPECC